MGNIINKLNNKYLIAVVTGLFVLGIGRRFIKR